MKYASGKASALLRSLEAELHALGVRGARVSTVMGKVIDPRLMRRLTHDTTEADDQAVNGSYQLLLLPLCMHPC